MREYVWTEFEVERRAELVSEVGSEKGENFLALRSASGPRHIGSLPLTHLLE